MESYCSSTYTPVLTLVLFTVAEARELPQYSLTEKWIKKMWYIYIYTHTPQYSMEFYSAFKKNNMMPFAAPWMDLEIIILSEVSQTEKQKSICHSLYVTSKKKRCKWTYKTKRDSQT